MSERADPTLVTAPLAVILFSVKTPVISLAVVLVLLCASCATDPGAPGKALSELPPIPERRPPATAVGLYLGRDATESRPDDGGVRIELRLFPDRSSFMSVSWSEDGETRGDAGSYRYNPETGKLWISFKGDAIANGFTTELLGRPAEFFVDKMGFIRLSEKVGFGPEPSSLSLEGAWILDYSLDGLPTSVVLELGSEGVFTESTRYTDSDEPLVESGIYEGYSDSTLVRFAFTGGSERAFTGLHDPERQVIITPDGMYKRIE